MAMIKQIFPGITGPLLFGHRGYSHLAPENTLAAFREILENNIPGVELDVHLSACGELVVIHDDNLKRLTGLDARVEETDYKVLSRLDAGSHFDPRFKKERIPLLEEVLTLLGDQVYYDIELKTKNRQPGKLERGVVDAVHRHRLQERCLISSFNPYALKACHALGWERTAIIYCNAKDLPFYLRNGQGRLIAGSPVIKPDWKELEHRPFYILRRPPRYPVITWTIDDAGHGRTLLETGVSGLISNNPSVHLKTLAKFASP